MSDARPWLDALGLGQYAECFAENGVTLPALVHLTEQDLKDLGVLLGHRRILLAAIAKLAAEEASGTPPPVVEEVAPSEPERRQLTVLFCDLVGSTALSTELDVEDYREVISTYQNACAGVVSRYDGYLAKFMGDGLLVYFGYPSAHEDDARRAVGAALEMIATVPKLDVLPDRPLAVRVGIATGEVVVGDIVGEGAAEERAVLGVTPNLAARLQGVAGENEIIIGDATRRRLRDAFLVSDLGTPELKGIAETTRVWRIEGPREGGGEAHRAVPFVGRGDALAKLQESWSRAWSGQLAVLHLSGQPGIGKSRLVREFIARLEGGEAAIWACTAFHRNTPLHPVPPGLISVAGPVDEPGEAQRRVIFEAVGGELARQAMKKPLLLAVEDAHWLDPTTAELLETLRRRLSEHPVLIIIASRPGDMADRLSDALGGVRLALEALAAEEAEALVQSVADSGMSDQVRRHIVERAGGLPLFLEELTRVVAQGEAVEVPVTLQESLLARLDAVGPAKRIAQLGSVIGQTFGRDDLTVLSEIDADAVGPALRRLVQADLLVEAEGRYAFRHALMQDVAYDTLLRSSRRRIHGEIADHLMNRSGGAGPEVIAHHLTEAGRRTEAAPRWLEAGRRSAQQWAHAEAAAHFEAALRCAADDAETAWELTARLDLVECLRILDRYDEALEQLERAEALAEVVGRDQDWLRLHVMRGNIYFPLGDADRCIASHQAAQGVARRIADPEAEARALSGIADAHFAGRRIASAEDAYDACVRLAEAHDLDAVTRANLSLRGHMRLYLCRIDEAREDCERAVDMATVAGDRRAEITARGSCLGKVLLEQGEFSAANRAFEEAGRIAAEVGAYRYEALNLLFRGKIALDAGDSGEAIAFGRRAVDIARESGPRFCLPMALGVVARAEQTAEACRAMLAEAEALIAAGCLAHNLLWFYRDAALAAVAHRWPGEAARYAMALRDAFAAEALPWCDLIADGADALTAWLERDDPEPVDAQMTRARALGFMGWARVLGNAVDGRLRA